jgi:hypothetical protein
MRSTRLSLVCLLLLALPLLAPAAPAVADEAAPEIDLVAAPADDCLAQSSAIQSSAPQLGAAETSPVQPLPELFQEAAQALQDDGLQLASSSCPCPLWRVGKKCTCPNCSYVGTCQLFAGNPICLTACADL